MTIFYDVDIHIPVQDIIDYNQAHPDAAIGNDFYDLSPSQTASTELRIQLPAQYLGSRTRIELSDMLTKAQYHILHPERDIQPLIYTDTTETPSPIRAAVSVELNASETARKTNSISQFNIHDNEVKLSPAAIQETLDVTKALIRNSKAVPNPKDHRVSARAKIAGYNDSGGRPPGGFSSSGFREAIYWKLDLNTDWWNKGNHASLLFFPLSPKAIASYLLFCVSGKEENAVEYHRHATIHKTPANNRSEGRLVPRSKTYSCSLAWITYLSNMVPHAQIRSCTVDKKVLPFIPAGAVSRNFGKLWLCRHDSRRFWLKYHILAKSLWGMGQTRKEDKTLANQTQA